MLSAIGNHRGDCRPSALNSLQSCSTLREVMLLANLLAIQSQFIASPAQPADFKVNCKRRGQIRQNMAKCKCSKCIKMQLISTNLRKLWHEQHGDKPHMLLTSVAWWFIHGLECMQTLLDAHEARMGLTKVLHKLKSCAYRVCCVFCTHSAKVTNEHYDISTLLFSEDRLLSGQLSDLTVSLSAGMMSAPSSPREHWKWALAPVLQDIAGLCRI